MHVPCLKLSPCGRLFPRIFFVVLALVLASIAVPAARGAGERPPTISLDQIKPGMTGVAYTIFAGDKIEKFDIVVIGVLPNLFGPKQSVILVQLKGDKVEHTGVVAGMSGSPVYIDGKLAGALSLKFGVFATEPLGGVTPIEDILSMPREIIRPPKALTLVRRRRRMSERLPRCRRLRHRLRPEWPTAALSGAGAFTPSRRGVGRLSRTDCPAVGFSGFAPATLRQYSADWMPYGMVATAGGTAPPEADDSNIVPGAMVRMVLVEGDISISAACTVTAMIGDRVYACGHPLFGLGASDMPLARGRMLTTLASDLNSTKMVNAGGVIGTLTAERATAVMGRVGASPQMIPVDLTVVTPGGERQFHV